MQIIGVILTNIINIVQRVKYFNILILSNIINVKLLTY